MNFKHLLLTISIFFFQSIVAQADDKVEKEPWTPSATEYDWVQLTSGEWLKGEIKSMYNESLEFDSDKLNLLNIDLEDIKYLQSFRPSLVNIEDMDSIFGKLNISEGMVSIGEGENVKTFERLELVSFVPGGTRELDLWTMKFALGLNVKSGNTNQLDFTTKFSAKRRTAKLRVITDYIANISETEGVDGLRVKNVNNQRLNGKLDVYVTRYFFYSPVFFEYYSDEFQNVDDKVTLGVGIGYTLIDTQRTDWSISGGPSYVRTKYLSVQEGDDLTVGAGSLSLGTLYEIEINKAVDFIFKYDAQISRAENGGATHFMATTIETEITGDLDLDVSFYWDRISDPTINENGTVPEKDDYRLMVGITYTY